MVVEPMSNARPNARSTRPGWIATISSVLADGDGHAPAARAQRLLQAGQHRQARAHAGQRPLRGERVGKPAEIARGVAHVGFGDFDVAQPHDGIDGHGARLGALADDLTMNLAFGRHVDDEIAAEFRLTAEPAAGGERAALLRIARLDAAFGRRMIRRRDERMLGEFALGDVDLTAPADAAPAADGIEIDAQPARGV